MWSDCIDLCFSKTVGQYQILFRITWLVRISDEIKPKAPKDRRKGLKAPYLKLEFKTYQIENSFIPKP